MAARQPRVDVADVVGACWSSSRPCPCSWGRGARSRGGSRSRATSRCIAAAASPPSTTPPPGMTRLGTPASAASCANRAARSGFTARITVSGRSGQRRRGSGSTACRGSPRSCGLTKWQRVSLPMPPEVVADRQARASTRGLAPTTAIERGANSGRRSMGAGARSARRHRDAAPRAQPTTASTPRFSSARAIDRAAGSRTCPPRCGPRGARAGTARRGTRACSRGRRTPARRGPRSATRPRTRTAWRATPWRGRPWRSRPASMSHGRLAGQQPGRRRVRGRVGEREAHALEVVDPLAELDPARSPTRRPA